MLSDWCVPDAGDAQYSTLRCLLHMCSTAAPCMTPSLGQPLALGLPCDGFHRARGEAGIHPCIPTSSMQLLHTRFLLEVDEQGNNKKNPSQGVSYD